MSSIRRHPGLMTSYAGRLAAAWEAHLAPRDADAPTVASVFAGCGGSSLGYSIAGYRELLAVEWDDHAAEVFRRNFLDVKLHHGDIKDVDPGMLGLRPGELDVLDGSPPCQGFSQFGHRQLDDPRNQLFRQFARLLMVWQPRAFVMENVRGLIEGIMRPLFAEMLTELKTAGYRVSARLVNASLLGVPQNRRRMIFIGMRSDLGIAPAHPAPAMRPLTVRQAWDDLEAPGAFKIPTGKWAKVARITEPGGQGSDALAARGGRRAYYSCKRLHWDRPSNTIVKEPGLLHPREDRLIGIHEAARIQSFPDQFDWGDGTYEQIHARIGNSVPPLMMQAIAHEVRRSLEAA